MIYLFITLAFITVHPHHHHKPKVVEKVDCSINVWQLPKLVAEPGKGGKK